MRVLEYYVENKALFENKANEMKYYHIVGH